MTGELVRRAVYFLELIRLSVHDGRARSFNWSLSLLALLSLIIFIIPLGLCLLLTHRTRTTPAPRTIFLTMIPFSLYLFLFYRVGSIIASLAVVSGSHSSGKPVLSRCSN